MPYLINKDIQKLIKLNSIITSPSFNKNQIQPASLDLSLSSRCYRIKASFIPNNQKISKIIKELSLVNIDLNNEYLFEKNCIYLCELNEKLNLPKEIKGKSNPKSTTGRLDIFTRLITENGTEYDEIDYNYSGKLYLEIIPQSFSIKLRKNICLNQVRFFEGIDESIKKKLKISVSIQKGKVSAYRAKKITSAIDLTMINHYLKEKYWEEIVPKNNSFIIEKDEFYILRSKEFIVIPEDNAA